MTSYRRTPSLIGQRAATPWTNRKRTQCQTNAFNKRYKARFEITQYYFKSKSIKKIDFTCLFKRVKCAAKNYMFPYYYYSIAAVGLYHVRFRGGGSYDLISQRFFQVCDMGYILMKYFQADL